METDMATDMDMNLEAWTGSISIASDYRRHSLILHCHGFYAKDKTYSLETWKCNIAKTY